MFVEKKDTSSLTPMTSQQNTSSKNKKKKAEDSFDDGFMSFLDGDFIDIDDAGGL